MHLSALLDCDLVAVEQNDELTLLVELTAPSPTTTAKRQPATLQVVLDRSGSMSGDRLEGAKSALIDLVERLDPADNLGVLAFDSETQIVVPAGPLTNKNAVTPSPPSTRCVSGWAWVVERRQCPGGITRTCRAGTISGPSGVVIR